MNWFYSPDGAQRHEVSEEALAALARDGRVTGDSLLWREGQSEWRPAREVRPDLFGPPADQPPPPPPPSPTVPEVTTPSPPWASVSPAAGIPAYAAVAPKRPTDSGALTSVISGAVGLVGAATGFCCCLGFLISPIAGLVAVIFGHQVCGRAQGHPEAESDRSLALIGLILGYATLLLTIGGIMWNLLVVGFAGVASALEGAKHGSFNP